MIMGAGLRPYLVIVVMIHGGGGGGGWLEGLVRPKYLLEAERGLNFKDHSFNLGNFVTL